MKKIKNIQYQNLLIALFLLSFTLVVLTGCSTATDLAVGVNAQEEPASEEGVVEETSAPSAPIGTINVVVALANIPAGERLRPELLEVQARPISNIAVRAGVTFSEIDLVIGKITKASIGEGEAVLAPMLALSSTDLSSSGSDLSLFVNNGSVAIAFPINRYSGMNFAGRPGDLIDVFMSFNLTELDVEFQTALPNKVSRVDEEALDDGMPFLLPETSLGRLETVAVLGNVVAQISPRGYELTSTAGVDESGQVTGGAEEGGTEGSVAETVVLRFPNRVTQMTIQQAELLWVGTWNNPDLSAPSESELAALGGISTARGLANRSDLAPDMIIISLPLQDALILKWALEEPGIDIDFALRSQNDNAIYFTTSVSLPQMVEQAGLNIPEPALYGLQPRIDGSLVPRLPYLSPEEEFKQQQQEQQEEGGSQ